MANRTKTGFLKNLTTRYGPLRRLPRSQSLYEIGDGAARIYVRYSKVHGENRTFYGLREEDLDGTNESKLNDGGAQMTPKEQPEVIWIVVLVESGIPVMAEAYRGWQSAKKRERFWRMNMRPDNDETGVFEVQVGYPTPC